MSIIRQSTLRKKLGSVAIEFMVLVIFIGLSLAIGAAMLGSSINEVFKNIGSSIASAVVPDIGGGTDPGGGTVPDGSLTIEDVTNGFTNNNTPLIHGVAQPGSTVNIYDGQTLIGTTMADPSGNWSLTSLPLWDGAHTISATQTDADGNSSELQGGQTFTVDTTPPVEPIGVAIIADGVTVGNSEQISNAQPTFSGMAEAGATVSISTAEGTLIGTTQVSASGEWQYTPPSPLANGSYDFYATVTDAAGNPSIPAIVGLMITIDSH